MKSVKCEYSIIPSVLGKNAHLLKITNNKSVVLISLKTCGKFHSMAGRNLIKYASINSITFILQYTLL